MAIEGFGKARVGSDGFQHFRMETPKSNDAKTSATYRILPPIKYQQETGKWEIYIAQHFGYKGRDSRDQTKLRNRPFKCIQDKNFKTGFVKKACPACDKRAEVKEKMELAVKLAQAKGLSEQQVKEVTATYSEWMREHNVDGKFKMFAVNEAGEIGDLSIGTKANAQLIIKIKELREQGFDPFDPDQGVYFNFHRSGKDFGSMIDTVEVATLMEKDANGKPTGRQSIKFAPLSVDIQRRALEVLPDLTELITVLTEDQISMIVHSDGDPEVVDAAFDASQPNRSKPTPTPTPTTERSAPLPTAEVVDAEPAEDDDVVDPSTDVKIQIKASSVEVPNLSLDELKKTNVKDLSDEAFSSLFGVKKAS